MQTLVLFAILSASMFYLSSRAQITSWLWSRYPPPIARFADCSACSGFWYGVILSLIFGDLFDPVFTRGRLLASYNKPFVEVWSIVLEAGLIGLCMLVLTPMVAGLMQHALLVVGSAVPDEVQAPFEDLEDALSKGIGRTKPNEKPVSPSK